ncbi:MAG TPA: cytochrome b/b6 domain-containing protein [Steroidobacteraceae bacterium]|jgi:thiosulfate reductase cytochrome b subunit
MAPIGSGGITGGSGHALWVRLAHWLGAASLITLAFSGFVILMAHPRLYWGEAGNDLTPTLLELPVSRNYQHGGYEMRTSAFPDGGRAVSAVRTYDIFNQNGWARSLHFLAAWLLLATGLAYLAAALAGGHLRRDLVPRAGELRARLIWQDMRAHLARVPQAQGGPPYNLLQKLAYTLVLLVCAPLMVVTGLAMSPAVNAAYPFLAGLFGGSQSARTVHFLCFTLLALFLVVHVTMVVLSGFRRQMRAMTLGRSA